MVIDELATIKEKRIQKEAAFDHTIKVCTAAGCISCKSDNVKDKLAELAKNSDGKKINIKSVGCLGLCSKGPLIEADQVMYQSVGVDDCKEVIDSLEKKPLKRLTLDRTIPFFTKQKKIVLENCGSVDPEDIKDYVKHDGYLALAKACHDLSPSAIIDEISASGLRGRGGAGYPTGLKWTTVAKAVSPEKYVVCNADEGDPGAYMDRSVLESDPHRVIEGMAIAAHAIGAQKGYVYLRAEYPLAIKRLKSALNKARRLGVLGNNIFERNFNFDIEIRLGAGAFVCGEETALMASIEGKRGTPIPRPPFPAEKGLWGKPTLINNVETYANIPTIIRNGGDWFAQIGTEKSKGTKVFALAGQINNIGLIEVPMGISVREIIFEIGNGIPEGNTFKAVQTGGPSGGCLPPNHLDTPVDYESLSELGAIMGSGGMIVMDQSSSMVDVAKYFMEFCLSESCGKCIPCRVGTVQMHGILKKIAAGQATQKDLELLKELCELVRNTSLCGLGQTAPNPVLSTLRFFENEYLTLLTEQQTAA